MTHIRSWIVSSCHITLKKRNSRLFAFVLCKCLPMTPIMSGCAHINKHKTIYIND